MCEMPDSEEQSSFICPECGSREAEIVSMVSPPPFDSSDPWTGVLQIITCAACGNEIPAHLAERWDDMLPEEAQREWRETYKDR